MMERGSSQWWFVLLLLAFVSVRWERAMTFHAALLESNMEHATRLELEAEHLNHSAITHQLQSVVNKHQGDALHQEATQLMNQSQQEEASYENEEKLAKEYKKLFERATKASQDCRARMDQEEQVSQEVRKKLQGYLDDLARLKKEHQGFCIDHWWTPMWYCDLVAKWTGLDQEQKNAAIQAQGKNESLKEIDTEEQLDELLEEELEKNATKLDALTENAEQQATLLKNAYLLDKAKAKNLEANATALLDASQEESDAAARDDAQAEEDRMEAQGLLKLAQFHGKKARSFAIASALSAILVLCAMTTHTLHLCCCRMRCRRVRQDDSMEKPSPDEESTVGSSSTVSEHSPLVDHASVSNESVGDISYLTVDLESWTTPSSVSFLSSAAISHIIHETMAIIRFHAQKIELVGAILVVAFLGRVLWSDTLPSLCALLVY